MTTANKITIFRVVLIPVFLVLMYLRFPGHMYWAFGVFVLASLSDFVDGYIARHYNQVTDFGKFMDPLADKLLVVSAMLMFVEQHQMPAWALLLTGGDTLLQCMNSVGARELEPVCELESGIVLARFTYQGRTRYVITKSGGFGQEDLLVELADRIAKH